MATMIWQRQRKTFDGSACLTPLIGMIGWARFREARYALREHAHRAAFEICYIQRGKVDWFVEDRIFQVAPGQVYITLPNERHGGVDAMLHPCELYWVQVDPTSQSGQVWKTIAGDLSLIQRRVFDASPEIPRLLRRILEEHRHKQTDSLGLTVALTQALLLQVLRDQREASRRHAAGNRLSPEISSAIDWMNGHVEEAYNLDEPAAAAGLGISQFHQRFRKETGFTPGEFRLRQRIDLSKRLLRDSRLPITQLAHQLGFSSSQYFATTFHRYLGLSPRAYRQHVSPE